MAELTAETITNADLRELFSRHCECRPLDLDRAEGDHAARHDCDLSICEIVQTALLAVDPEEVYGARFECARRLEQDRRMGYGNRHAVVEAPRG